MKQLESFVGLANIYNRIILDFATKMLPLMKFEKKNSDGKRKNKMLLKTSKTSYVLTPLYSLTA